MTQSAILKIQHSQEFRFLLIHSPRASKPHPSRFLSCNRSNALNLAFRESGVCALPFNNFVAHAFTPPAIRALAPQSPGVFGISSAREWIYIGEADNIQQALLLLFAGESSPMMARRPTGFVFEICHAALRTARQDRLVMEYEPICNRTWDQHSARQGGAQ